MRPGKLFILSAPSGAGKTTLAQQLLNRNKRCVRSISVTTRIARKGEKDGRDYYFGSKNEFLNKRAKGEFLEWARVFGNYYGTPRFWVEQKIRQGKHVIACLDVQGAKQIKRKCPQAVLIFVMPPKMKALEERLKKRETDTLEEIRSRLKIAEWEMSQADQYDYELINDRLTGAIQVLSAIVIAEEHRMKKKQKVMPKGIPENQG